MEGKVAQRFFVLIQMHEKIALMLTKETVSKIW